MYVYIHYKWYALLFSIIFLVSFEKSKLYCRYTEEMIEIRNKLKDDKDVK